MFSYTFFFSSTLGPYNSNAVTFDTVPGVSETILSSFHSFYYYYFHHIIFQLTDLFFCY